jgi:hypothetical protein
MSLEEAFNLTPVLEAGERVSKRYRLADPRRRRFKDRFSGWRDRRREPGRVRVQRRDGMLFVKTSHSPAIIRLVPARRPTGGPVR